MRILGIESSSPIGSVALIENGRVVREATHQKPNAHAEELLPMVERLLSDVSWSKASLERVGVGIGPGSFTGLRVGVALAQGIAQGLALPLVGIPSLEAMVDAATRDAATGAEATADSTLYCPLVDARRGEVFAALYRPSGELVKAPWAIAQSEAGAAIRAAAGDGVRIELIGKAAHLLTLEQSQHSTQPRTDFPHAAHVALLAEARTPEHTVAPYYVRPPDAVVPKLPPNPLQE